MVLCPVELSVIPELKRKRHGKPIVQGQPQTQQFSASLGYSQVLTQVDHKQVQGQRATE